ncbi:hypothetical protein L3i20_v232390 [Paenibacillus sp. L3-i20]|nr:hypothetical protein L3i20_v232390 [Paenibacillus sp. L3-i20]
MELLNSAPTKSKIYNKSKKILLFSLNFRNKNGLFNHTEHMFLYVQVSLQTELLYKQSI